MLYDNKFYASNYDQLVTYYPMFYRDVLEMDEIFKVEGALLDDLETGIDAVLANAFIDTCDADTLSQLESFLGLKLGKSRTDEERRRLIRSFLSGGDKLSATEIAETIYAYTGAEVDVVLEPYDDEGNNILSISFLRGDYDTVYITDIYNLLSRKIPAHLEYRIAVLYRWKVVISRKRSNYRTEYSLCGEDILSDDYY